MANRKIKIPLALVVMMLAMPACSSFFPQAEPAIAATQIQQPAVTQQFLGDIPQTEADVPRISVDDAKAALDSGQAIIVDVRSAEAFALGHAAGAISIPLGEIENDPTGLSLEKSQWIITYCT